MTRLYSSYYIDPVPERQKELDECLQRNLDNSLISEVVLLLEYPIDSILLHHKKIKSYLIHSRPTYNTFFEIINQISKESDWNIIANSDIFFDETIGQLDARYSGIKVCLALCRWEIAANAEISFLNRPDAQDAWIFKGHINKVNGDFCLGVCGCDNAIAHRFKSAGYAVINPSKTFKCYHLHNSGIRNYNINDKVSQPYLILTPTA